MKLSTSSAFAAFVFLAVVNSPQTFAAPPIFGSMSKVVAVPKVPHITRDNFVSLSWSWSELVFADTGSTTTILALKGNTLSYESSTIIIKGGGNQPNVSPSIEIAGVSNNQISALIQQLNSSSVVIAAKSERNSSIALTFSDRNNKDQTLELVSAGSSTPTNNVKIAVFLLAMARQKFPNMQIVPPASSTARRANATSR